MKRKTLYSDVNLRRNPKFVTDLEDEEFDDTFFTDQQRRRSKRNTQNRRMAQNRFSDHEQQLWLSREGDNWDEFDALDDYNIYDDYDDGDLGIVYDGHD